jgi:hypothetical protein
MSFDTAAWRRVGFGILMINSLIKQSSTISDNSEVDIYLQWEENSAFNFYCYLGCQQVNAHNTDGFDLLPDDVQEYFKKIKAATEEGQCTSLLQPTTQCESRTPFPLKLMHLQHGQLHTLVPNFNAMNSRDNSSNNDSIQELPFDVEKFASMLYQESLDDCCSSATIKATFSRLRRGYYIRYEGKKQQKRMLVDLKYPPLEEERRT